MSLNQQLLELSLLEWYKQHPIDLDIVNRLNQNNKNFDDVTLPSLRQIDYCVVNYSKHHKIIYYIDQEPIEIYSDYKTQLKAFSKDFFDPFRRGHKFYIGDIETTLCQLNFFRWAIPKGILRYTMTNSSEIESEMNQKIATRKRENALIIDVDQKPGKQHLNKISEYICAIHDVTSTAFFIKPSDPNQYPITPNKVSDITSAISLDVNEYLPDKYPPAHNSQSSNNE